MPGREYSTCHLCGATDQALCYNLPKSGFADRPVCDEDGRCDSRAKRAWLVLSAAGEARAAVARAKSARDVLRR
jgi:hypothetical protein